MTVWPHKRGGREKHVCRYMFKKYVHGTTRKTKKLAQKRYKMLGCMEVIRKLHQIT